MAAWESFVIALLRQWTKPEPFSVFHIVCIVIILGLAIGIVFINKKMNDKAYKYVILGIWITLLILEGLKQIVYSYDYIGGKLIVNYKWSAFPFQFCSMPLYLLPFIVFLKDCKAKKRFELFAAIFFLMGGMAASIYPTFHFIIFPCFQTMIHHGLMIVSAILIAVRNKNEFKFINLLQASLIFVGCFIIAIILQSVITSCIPASRDRINLFFISWYLPPPDIVGKWVWQHVPYWAYFILYLIAMAAVIFTFYVIYSACLNHRVDFTIREKKIDTNKK